VNFKKYRDKFIIFCRAIEKLSFNFRISILVWIYGNSSLNSDSEMEIFRTKKILRYIIKFSIGKIYQLILML